MSGYDGIRLMNRNMKARNMKSSSTSVQKVVGVARTGQITTANDFFAVLQGLHEAEPGEVLCVNTKGSTRAVAGGLFCLEAERKGLSGLIIEGAIRDINTLQQGNILCYSTSSTPYSGTINSLGVMQSKIECGGVNVSPGDLVVGDHDGVVVGTIDTMETLISTAENIVAVESSVIEKIKQGVSLHSMTNYSSHLTQLTDGKDSSFAFSIDDD